MIHRILDFSIAQRWLVVTLVAAVAVAGGFALSRLPIDAVPDITNNQVQINTLAPQLSPLEIEKQVTFRIETALAGLPGLEYTRSLSRNGFSQVTAVFSEKTSIYFARQQIGERLTELRGNLPPGVAPRMGPISTGLGEIYMWTLSYKEIGDAERRNARTGEPGWQPDGRYLTPEGQYLANDVERAAYLRTVQDWLIAPQLKGLPGVAGIDSIGGHVKQYQVSPDPAKLIGFGIGFADVIRAIEANNASRGASVIERNGEAYVVRAGGRVETMADISAITLATRNGVPVRVRDIAEVTIGGETRVGSASENGKEVVVGTAMMRIGENSRAVAAVVDARIAELQPSLPPGITIKPVMNRTLLVNATIATVVKNLTEGALLVILVLFALLGNVRAALITACVIPLTMLMTGIGMLQTRMSANLMSLGALDFGLIVDGAVIIVENCMRHLGARQHEEGRLLSLDERLSTVRLATAEMIAPTVYGQAIIMLVYVPMLTFSGVEGKMFEPMALTVMIALACAFVLSLTFVPAIVAIFATGTIRHADTATIGRLKTAYAPVLRRAIARPLPVIGAAAALFALSLLVFGRLGQEFLPTLDEKNIVIHALRIPGTALSQAQAMQFEVEKTVSAFPQVALVFSKTGTAEIASDPMPPNLSDTFVILKPQAEWPDPSLPKAQLVRDIEKAVGALPGNAYEFTQPIQMRSNELLAGVRGDLAIKVFGDEFEPMLRTAQRIAGILRGIEGADDVKIEQAEGLPVLDIDVNKAELSRRGLSLTAVHDVIGIAIGGRDAGVVYEGDRHFEIVVRLSERLRGDIETLKNLPVTLPPGATGSAPSIPLREVADFRFSEGPNQISRENGKRRVVITANVRGRDIASLVDEARSGINQQVTLPPGSWLTFGGQFENLSAARDRLMLVVPACFAAILLLLFMALRSLRDAVLVFSAVPLALTGGIMALWLRGMPFSVSAAVGFIALSGIAVLNGLVMLNSIRQLVAGGTAPMAAIEEGALIRLRPVVMTALVAALGFVPMALAAGTGAEVQRPLATVVIGGLLSATALTLLVLPALYARFGKSEQGPQGHQPDRQNEAVH
jgi:cobalt-zinc-cadmium resistance protein CzcA